MMKKVDGIVKGFLCDWALSKDLDASANTSVMEHAVRRNSSFTSFEKYLPYNLSQGTWQFMAIRLLRPVPPGEPPPNPDRLDDEESFYHVLMWMILRYSRHSFPVYELSHMLYEIFEGSFESQGKRYLSSSRMSSLLLDSPFDWMHIANQGLRITPKSLKRILMYRYFEADFSSEEDYCLHSHLGSGPELLANRTQAWEVMGAKD